MEKTTAVSTLKAGFKNSFAALEEKFYDPSLPEPVHAPVLQKYNRKLGQELGFNFTQETPELADCLAGNLLFADSTPIAMAYAGHQFGNFVPQLGDGRAILLGEKVTPDGRRLNIQLKGSGRTRFSRGGDGKSPLGPVIREYIVSEAMHALGVPTTRALAIVSTGEKIPRQDGIHPGGIMTRVASGLVRVGSFEYFAARGDEAAIRMLADYVLARHYPEILGKEDRYRQFFSSVATRQARLVAKWMQLGFIHGVMNTDNTSISGETIDYGPCAFMDYYDPNMVFSSIDTMGRYRYANQSAIMRWNLNCLGVCLQALIGKTDEEAMDVIDATLAEFEQEFLHAQHVGMLKKIGIENHDDQDSSLLGELLAIMQNQKTDFTLTFRYLADHIRQGSNMTPQFRELFNAPDAVAAWLKSWQLRLVKENNPEVIQEKMNRVNPLFIPRNHRIHKAIENAEARDDFSQVHLLTTLYENPFTAQPDFINYAQGPADEERVTRTFCGT
ncbi:YdiU family protein [Desulfobacter hydrogenophilus]|uniref:Protein nucleotidyltransferase YdiU n=1 Tax=Desulfobacter hydrogenophilus TaxID=2291 RepID=A0A328FBD9_9BACT|nr:YdiU family protein [Desulfobacter hydrogenophilus]NDY74258.1 YdiU family protein [Desulfobacter hydrogenophilus]QBH14590.1 YdiU family protein [Desulfobacter hydrogenophilus]RAM00423.1 YdiU family protein [Desulfobacter hydrogenophilus]